MIGIFLHLIDLFLTV